MSDARFGQLVRLALTQCGDPCLAVAAAEKALEMEQMQQALAIIDQAIAEHRPLVNAALSLVEEEQRQRERPSNVMLHPLAFTDVTPPVIQGQGSGAAASAVGDAAKEGQGAERAAKGKHRLGRLRRKLFKELRLRMRRDRFNDSLAPTVVVTQEKPHGQKP